MDSAILEQWRLGAELGARGLYGQAEAIAGELLADDRVTVRALASALIASHRRQLGDHACARFHDDRSLHEWESSDLEASWPYVDLLISRAADAVGLDELDDADYWLATADALAADGDTRTSVRYGWVQAELALARGDAAEALRSIDALELPLARLRSGRHAVKTRLIRGIVLHELGRADEAIAELDRVLAESTRAHWHSLIWQAALVRGRATADPAQQRSLYGVARAMIELILLDLHPSRAASFEDTLPPELSACAARPSP